MVKVLGKENDIDESYFIKLANESIKHIAEYGDPDWFRSDVEYDGYIPAAAAV